MSPIGKSTEANSEPNIHLYAEHLQNIRTLSIQASLATASNQETQAKLSTDGSLLTLQHEGSTASVQLPLSLGEHSDATLPIPAAPAKDLSFRLNIKEKHPASGHLGTNGSTDGLFIPWMSGDLTTETEIQCAECNAVLVSRGEITEWKDLPSDRWAEMMEFWHCHKPDVPHDHDHGKSTDNAGRGFAANSTLALLPGVGLVGPTDFLLALDDCRNIETQQIPSTPISTTELCCRNCHIALGVHDHTTDGYKLQKSSLAISPHHASDAISYPREKWLSCSILNNCESQGVRRLLVHVRSDKHQPASVMHVWLFAPEITISSSAASTAEAMRVAKFLSKPGTASDIDKLDGMSSTEGELELDKAQWETLTTQLQQSSHLLPRQARTFQNWNVGLLARFTEKDIRGPHRVRE